MINENNKIDGLPPLEDIMNETGYHKNKNASKQNISLDGLPPLDSILNNAGYNNNDFEEIVEEEPQTYHEPKSKPKTSNKDDTSLMVYITIGAIIAGALVCGITDCSKRLKQRSNQNHQNINYQESTPSREELNQKRKQYRDELNDKYFSTHKSWKEKKDDYERRRNSNKRSYRY